MGAIGGLLQGIVAGRQLRMQMNRAADEHQQLQQELQQRDQMAQQQQHDSAMKMLSDRMNLEMMGARPASNGLVEDMLASPDGQSGPQPNGDGSVNPLDQLRGSASNIAQPAPPAGVQNPGQGKYMRKADKSRTVSIPWAGGEKLDYEIPTREEQIARGNQIAEAQQMRAAMGLAKTNQYVLQAFGVDTPPAIATAFPGLGPKLRRDEIAPLTEKLNAMRNANLHKFGPGQTLKEIDPNAAPGTEPRTVATGGPVTTGPNGAFEAWLPGYYQQQGISAPQPKDKSAAYEQFLKLKPEDAETEVALAQRAARGDKDADAALQRLNQSRIASRPVNTFNVSVPGLGGQQNSQQALLTGEDYLKTIPASTAAQIRGIAEGRSQMPSGTSRSQAAQQLRQAVFQYDPTYTDQRAQVRKAFTTGTDGRNIGALNTAAVHLDQLGDAAAALGNGSFTPGNAIYQKMAQMFGSAAPTNFEAMRATAAGELANALKGTATDPEIASIKATIEKQGSPKALAGAINTYLPVLHTKLDTYQQRYQQQIPNDTVYSPVLPAAQAVFAKHGVGKTVAASLVHQFATEHNVDDATAQKAFEAKGYTVK